MDGTAIAAIVIGLGATAAAMVMPIKFPNAPGWMIELAWWGGLTLVAGGILYLVIKWLRANREPSPSPLIARSLEPTFESQLDAWIPIADAIQHVSRSIGDANKAECYPDTLKTIRGAAYDNKISIRGRKQLPSRGDFRLRDAYSDLPTDIESAYWQNSVLNAFSTSPEQRLDYHTRPETTMAWGPLGPDERNHYADLLVNEADLFRQWPKLP
jgi:hypothetical protein